MNRIHKVLASVASACVALTGAVVVSTATATSASAAGSGRVLADPCLNLRAQPNGGSQLLGCIAKGTQIPIDCTATGNAVQGPYGTTTLWDHTTGGFVSDAWVFTGTAAAVAQACGSSAPAPAPAPAAEPRFQWAANSYGECNTDRVHPVGYGTIMFFGVESHNHPKNWYYSVCHYYGIAQAGQTRSNAGWQSFMRPVNWQRACALDAGGRRVALQVRPDYTVMCVTGG